MAFADCSWRHCRHHGLLLLHRSLADAHDLLGSALDWVARIHQHRHRRLHRQHPRPIRLDDLIQHRRPVGGRMRRPHQPRSKRLARRPLPRRARPGTAAAPSSVATGTCVPWPAASTPPAHPAAQRQLQRIPDGTREASNVPNPAAVIRELEATRSSKCSTRARSSASCGEVSSASIRPESPSCHTAPASTVSCCGLPVARSTGSRAPASRSGGSRNVMAVGSLLRSWD